MSDYSRAPKIISSAAITLPREGETGLHTQPANEFLLTETGSGIHRTFTGDHPFGKGDIHFFPRGQLHDHIKRSKTCRCLTVRIRDEALTSEDPVDREAHNILSFLKWRALTGENIIPEPKGKGRPIAAHLRRAVAENGQPTAYTACVVKGIALEILGMAGAALTRQALPQRDSRIVTVLSYLDAHATEKIEVTALAKMAYLSRSHFHALFKQATGVPLIDYLTRIRIGMAVIQLTSGDDTVTQIAFRCGFTSLSRFYEAFRQFKGCEPSALR